MRLVIILVCVLIALLCRDAAYASDTLNVMVVVTPAAITGLGGSQATRIAVTHDIDNINQSFINSGIQGFVRLVFLDTFRVDEIGCMYNMLNDILTVRGPELQRLHNDREIFAADVVVVIVDEPSQCGISGSCGYSNEAYIIVHYGCLGANYSMARQLGYLLGCGNNQSQSGRFPVPDYTAYGYFHDLYDENPMPNGSFSTIMGYTDERLSSNESDFNMIPYWSSADTTNIRYNNLPVGDKDHDNASAIRSWLPYVAGYKDTYGLLRAQGITLGQYDYMRLGAKRRLSLDNVVLDEHSDSEISSKKARLERNVRIKRGAKARITSRRY